MRNIDVLLEAVGATCIGGLVIVILSYCTAYFRFYITDRDKKRKM